MPIVIRHNGALNDIAAGLAQGVEDGQKLAAQKAAVDEAKQRRALEERRIGLAESAQTFDQAQATAESERRKVESARIDSERRAGQAANARAMGQVENGAPVKIPQSGGSIYGKAGNLAGMMADHQAQIEEAKAVARHMAPEAGAEYVKSEEGRIKKARGDALKPRLIEAWKKSLTMGQAQTDPNNPGAAVYQDPKGLARAQMNLQGLQDGTLDVDQSMAHFQAQQADNVNRRNDINRRSLFTGTIQNRIARMTEIAQTNPELESDLVDRVHEAQGYLDEMNDPAIDPGDAKDYYEKAMATLHGRGSSGSSGKKQRSVYSEARKMAQEDVKSLGLPPSTAGAELDRLTKLHVQALQDEINPPKQGAATPKEQPIDPGNWSLSAFDSTFPGHENPASSRPPAAGGAQAQATVPPGAGGVSGDAPAGAQASTGKAPADDDVEGWQRLAPNQRDDALTEIAMQDQKRAVQIAERLGLGAEKQSGKEKAQHGKDELTQRLRNPTSKSQLQADWAEYEKRYGGLPTWLRDEIASKSEDLPE